MLSLFPNLKKGVFRTIFIPLALKTFIQPNRVSLLNVISWHPVFYSLLITVLIKLTFVEIPVVDNINIPAYQIDLIACVIRTLNF